MFNSTKVRAALAACAISITAFGGITTAQAGGKTETKVSIKGDNGDYYGYVKSDKKKCASSRKVKVFKQKGKNQEPKKDKKIGTDISDPNGKKSEWAIGNSGYKSGKFYAKVGKTDSCKGATSKTITR